MSLSRTEYMIHRRHLAIVTASVTNPEAARMGYKVAKTGARSRLSPAYHQATVRSP